MVTKGVEWRVRRGRWNGDERCDRAYGGRGGAGVERRKGREDDVVTVPDAVTAELPGLPRSGGATALPGVFDGICTAAG